MSEKSEIQMTVDTPAPAEVETPKPFGGYATVEELVAAHTALMETAGTSTTVESETPAIETPPAEEPPPEGLEIPKTDDEAQATVAKAGLDWDALNGEYAENGKLSDETYEKLAQGGIPREAVDTYIRGKQAEVEAYEGAVFGAAGGHEDYAALVAWAKSGYTPSEIKAFNDAVTSGDLARAQLAVEALKARHAAKRGTPPAGLLHGRGDGTGVQPYASRNEMAADMRNPKYKSDPDFRNTVVARLRASQF